MWPSGVVITTHGKYQEGLSLSPGWVSRACSTVWYNMFFHNLYHRFLMYHNFIPYLKIISYSRQPISTINYRTTILYCFCTSFIFLAIYRHNVTLLLLLLPLQHSCRLQWQSRSPQVWYKPAHHCQPVPIHDITNLTTLPYREGE